jgi:hypothetical protein
VSTFACSAQGLDVSEIIRFKVGVDWRVGVTERVLVLIGLRGAGISLAVYGLKIDCDE